MERRRDPRFTVAVPTRITLLGPKTAEVNGTVIDVSERGMQLLLPVPAPPGSLIKLEWADGFVLGEVCWCRQENEGFSAGVQLEHSLKLTEDLEQSAQSLRDDQTQALDKSCGSS